MSNEIEKEKFNPKFLKIKDYKTAEEYKNDFFVKNIVDTTEYYELAILNSYFIHPFLSLKSISQASQELYGSDKLEITYRKVNDWGSKGLFEDNRASSIQWRKYSVNTGIKLLIINDLKRFGYSNEEIKYILAQICEDSCSVLVRNKKFNYKYFDFYASTFYKTGINFLIMIDNDCNAFYLTEKDLALNITDSLDISKPHLILPFSKYLQVFAKYIFNRENEGVITKFVSLSEELPNGNEKYLIEQFRNNKNDEIHIKNKKSDNSKIVKTKKTINNIKLSDKEFVNLCKKDKYKKITSTVKDNGNYDITIEETEKLR